MNIEEYNKKQKELNTHLRYYAFEISGQYEYIKGLEKYKIYNEDLEEHYNLLSGLIETAYNKILNFRQDVEVD